MCNFIFFSCQKTKQTPMHLVYYHTRTAPATASPLVEYYGGEAKWGPYVLYGGLFLGILLLIGVFLWSRRHATDPPRNEYTPSTIDDLLPVALTNATEKAKPSPTTESSSSSENQGTPTTVVTTGPSETKSTKKIVRPPKTKTKTKKKKKQQKQKNYANLKMRQ